MSDNNLDRISARFFSFKERNGDTWVQKNCYAKGYCIFEGELLLFWVSGEDPILRVAAGTWEGLTVGKKPLPPLGEPTPDDPDQEEPDLTQPQNTKFTWS